VKPASLLLLRVSLGLLMLLWGADKLVNVQHGLLVSQTFYFGLFSSASLLKAFGVLQIVLGLLFVLGVLRRIAYLALAVVTGTTPVGVWRSIVDLGLVHGRQQRTLLPVADHLRRGAGPRRPPCRGRHVARRQA
jgi:hypothetical protein